MSTPSIGRIVHYRLRADQASDINRRRQHAKDHVYLHMHEKRGTQVHVGNSAQEGDTFPMMITRVWGSTPDSAVNGQVMLDGNDLLWATSVCVGDGPGQFSWPIRT